MKNHTFKYFSEFRSTHLLNFKSLINSILFPCFKNFIGLLVALSLPILTWANDTGVTQKSDPGILEWILNNMLLVFGLMVILGAFAALIYMNNMLLQIQKVRLLQEHGIEVMEKVQLLSEESWWSRLYEKMTKAVPIEKEKDVMLDHNYDGIRELDNVLPPWWVATFYISIVFGIFYFSYYHLTDKGLSSVEEYELAMEEAEDAVKAYLASRADLVNENNVELLTDAAELALGESIFKAQCTPCHGQFGEGNSIGPNFTDEYWLHGGGIKNVFKTIKYGVPEKGMISWKSQLRASDMQRIASYILSLQGTNPPNAKEPQGEIWKEEDDAEGKEMGMK